MRSIQWMLLGISIMLLAGFLMVDTSSNMNDSLSFFLVLGFGVTLFGFLSSKDK